MGPSLGNLTGPGKACRVMTALNLATSWYYHWNSLKILTHTEFNTHLHNLKICILGKCSCQVHAGFSSHQGLYQKQVGINYLWNKTGVGHYKLSTPGIDSVSCAWLPDLVLLVFWASLQSLAVQKLGEKEVQVTSSDMVTLHNLSLFRTSKGNYSLYWEYFGICYWKKRNLNTKWYLIERETKEICQKRMPGYQQYICMSLLDTQGG